jgi:hypothetical protein
MTLYRQVNGEQVPLTEEEVAQLKLSWEEERKRQLTEGFQDKIRCHAGEPYRLIELIWNGINEGKIPGKDTEFYACIAEAKKKAEEELLADTGLTKEELDKTLLELST